jgi:hypothetical protein
MSLQWFTSTGAGTEIPPILKSVVEDVILHGLEKVLSDSRLKEIAKVDKNWNFFDGDQETYLQQYPDEEDAEFNVKLKPIFNYTQMVVAQYIMGVYGLDPTVILSDEAAQAWWDEQTVDNPNLNKLSLFHTIQQIAELSNYCAVVPKFSYLYDRGYSDKNNGRNWRRVEVYSKEIIQAWDIDIDKKQAYLKFDELNQYVDDFNNPVIPVTIFTPKPSPDSFTGNSGIDQIVGLNEAFNQLWMDLLHIVKYQSFSVLVYDHGKVGSEDDVLSIEVSPRHLLAGDGVKASYAVPHADIAGVLKVMEALKKELLDLSRMPIHMLAGTGSKSAESGISLKIKRLPTIQLWEERQRIYGSQHVTLTKNTLIVANAHIGRGFKTHDLAVTVDWGELEDLISAEEEMSSSLWKLELGVISVVDLMRKENPDLTWEQAKDKVMENLKVNVEMQQIKASLNGDVNTVLDDQLRRMREQNGVNNQNQG